MRICRPNGFEGKGFLDLKLYFWIEQWPASSSVSPLKPWAEA